MIDFASEPLKDKAMRLSTLASIAAVSLATLAAAAAAKQPQNSEESEITVIGTRDVASQVREFVAALTPAPVDGNVARFEASICPRIIGALPKQNEMIERRLRTVAKAAGLPLGRPGCGGNALMIITQDKRTLIESLQKQGNYFGDRVTPSQRRQLARQAGPTAFWRLEGFVTASGTVLAASDGQQMASQQNSGRASRISTGTRIAVDGAILVVEARALEGLTTTQLGDYAAMRLYGFADPTSVPKSAPTILTVLNAELGSEVPITMTPWDLSFLRALYASSESLRSPAQRSEIGRRLLRELSRSADTPR
jgi:hypothetical protein